MTTDHTGHADHKDNADQTDHVDLIVSMWNAERPDLDVSGMAVIGRIGRLERLIRPKLNEVFSRHELESWEFDVLATLRRSGAPYQLTAGALLELMMITSGTMTNRIDRLEGRGLIARAKDPADRRVVLVTLTAAGLAKIDAAVADHVENESAIISALSAGQQQELISLLRLLEAGQVEAGEDDRPDEPKRRQS
jgi:DNA-binding MarR family transcriptional regulator